MWKGKGGILGGAWEDLNDSRLGACKSLRRSGALWVDFA
jgi:hypothetical protein